MRGFGLPAAASFGRMSQETTRVYVRPPARADEQEFTALMRASRNFHKPWATAPTDAGRYAAYLEDNGRKDFEAFLVCRQSDDAIVGFFNISQIFYRSFQSAYLGYAAGETFAGQGYMREGMQLVLRVAFMELKLHRLEANIQPENKASVALAAAPDSGERAFRHATSRLPGAGVTTSAGRCWPRSGRRFTG